MNEVLNLALPPAAPPQRSKTRPSSQAAANAERHIAELESEKEALTAEVSGLQHSAGRRPPSEWPHPRLAPLLLPPLPNDQNSVCRRGRLAADGMPARVLIRYHSKQRGRSHAS